MERAGFQRQLQMDKFNIKEKPDNDISMSPDSRNRWSLTGTRPTESRAAALPTAQQWPRAGGGLRWCLLSLF